VFDVNKILGLPCQCYVIIIDVFPQFPIILWFRTFFYFVIKAYTHWHTLHVVQTLILCTSCVSDKSTKINLQEPCVLYIGRAYRYPPDVASYVFFSTNISTEYFKHAAHSPFISSKCCLFHNANFFWFMYYSHFTFRVC
jgi:hypothetical protein